MSTGGIRPKPATNTPLEIALLVQMLPIEDGAALITQYGNMRASEGRCDEAVAAFKGLSKPRNALAAT